MKKIYYFEKLGRFFEIEETKFLKLAAIMGQGTGCLTWNEIAEMLDIEEQTVYGNLIGVILPCQVSAQPAIQNGIPVLKVDFGMLKSDSHAMSFEDFKYMRDSY